VKLVPGYSTRHGELQCCVNDTVPYSQHLEIQSNSVSHASLDSFVLCVEVPEEHWAYGQQLSSYVTTIVRTWAIVSSIAVQC
jgi:hypothetical protein